MRNPLMAVLPIALIAACASSALPQAAGRTPHAVTASTDPLNRYVLANTTPGISLSLWIEGSRVQLDSAQVARIPKPRDWSSYRGPTIALTALAHGRVLSRAIVPDVRYSVDEGGGGNRPLARRQITATLPTTEIADTVEIRISDDTQVTRLDVRPYFAAACRLSPSEPICRSERPKP